MPRTSTTWQKGRPAPPTAFKPGQSGNPKGRVPAIDDIHALARSHAPQAIATLVKMLDDPDQCIAAAVALLDRGLGKPPQAIFAQVDATMTAGGVDAPPTIDESDEEWLARRRGELALIAAETKPRH